jgi:hypothetical protein
MEHKRTSLLLDLAVLSLIAWTAFGSEASVAMLERVTIRGLRVSAAGLHQLADAANTAALKLHGHYTRAVT